MPHFPMFSNEDEELLETDIGTARPREQTIFLDMYSTDFGHLILPRRMFHLSTVSADRLRFCRPHAHTLASRARGAVF